jgi:hypothetical protein
VRKWLPAIFSPEAKQVRIGDRTKFFIGRALGGRKGGTVPGIWNWHSQKLSSVISENHSWCQTTGHVGEMTAKRGHCGSGPIYQNGPIPPRAKRKSFKMVQNFDKNDVSP